MSEEPALTTAATTTVPEAQAPAAGATTPAAVKNPDSDAPEHMIPKSRFDEVNSELQKMRDAAAQAAKAQEKAQAEALAAQGKYEELYKTAAAELEAVRPYKEKFEGVLTKVTETNAKRIEAIPENMRTLVPSYDDPMVLQNWLDANEAILKSKPTAPDLNGGSGNRAGNQQPGPSLSELKELAARMGVSVDYLAQSYGVKAPAANGR